MTFATATGHAVKAESTDSSFTSSALNIKLADIAAAGNLLLLSNGATELFHVSLCVFFSQFVCALVETLGSLLVRSAPTGKATFIKVVCTSPLMAFTVSIKTCWFQTLGSVSHLVAQHLPVTNSYVLPDGVPHDPVVRSSLGCPFHRSPGCWIRLNCCCSYSKRRRS